MTQAQFFSRCLARHLCASGKEGNRAWPSPRRSLQWISASVIVVSSLVLASCKGLAILKDYKEDNCRIINHALLCSGSDTQLNFAVYFYTSLGFIDPASNSNGTPPYYPFFVRQSNCSLTRVVLDSTMTVVEQDADYQDALHQFAQIPTTADKFPNGCDDPTTGISFQQGAIVGKFSNGNTAVAITSPDGVLVSLVNSQGSVVSQQDYPTVPANNASAVIFGIASADLNGDGVPDMVVASELYGQSPGTLSIFLGKGDGAFTAGQVITVPPSSSDLGMTIQDVNGDGKPDLVAVTSAPGMDVFLGNGDGTFPATGKAGPAGAGGSVVVSADFNGDSKPDLATNTGQILLGNGDGTFQLLSQTVGAGQLDGMAAADYNQDGKIDLAFLNQTTETIDVYYGNGDGSFSYSASYPSIFGGFNLQASDLDGDGYPDLFAGTAQSGVFAGDLNTASFFYSPLNYGDGTFGKSRAYLPSNYVIQHFSNNTNAVFDVADFTGDGKPDIVTLDFSASGAFLSVLSGNGDGTFSQPGIESQLSGFTASMQVAALAAADVNGDGKPDAVFAWADDSGNGHVSVALGKGDGTFESQTDYAVPGSGVGVLNGLFLFGNGAANGMGLAPVIGGGNPDIVFIASPGSAGSSMTSLYVMLNNGNGTFQTPQLIDTKPYLEYLALGDVNGDGNADIVVAGGDLNNKVSATGYLYLSKGDGTFQDATTLTFGSDYPGPVAIADVNGDGKPDIVFAGENSNLMGGNVQVLLGNGNGAFQTGSSTPHSVLYPSTIGVADLTMNGHEDVALGGCCGFNSFYILPGNGDGTFQSANALSTYLPVNPVYLKLMDVNGDGFPEMFAASSANGPPAAIDVLVSSKPTLTPTSTALQASATSINSGQSVTFTATVAPQSGSGIPTGTVNFMNGATIIGGGMLNSSGVATFSTSSLETGPQSITAAYQGDTNFAASTSTAVSVQVTASTPAATSTALSSSANPSLMGQSVTFTATVTSAAGTPSGTVNFLDGATQLGSGSLNGSGQATFGTSTLAQGAHSLTASYVGTSSFAASTSAVLTQTVNGVPDFSVSASPASQSVNPGQSTSYTLTLAPVNGSTEAVTIACSGAPATVTCTPAASSVTLNGTSASKVLVNVGTTGASAALRQRPPIPPPPHLSRLGPQIAAVLASCLAGLLALGGLGRFQSFARRRSARWGLLMLVMLCALEILRCGGSSQQQSSSSSAGPTGTPAGTYTLTLTGTSGNTTHSTNVSLVVQ